MLLDLQGSVGNSAVARLVNVQRHSSFEHQLMGDTPPKDISAVANGLEGKHHALSEEIRRVSYFADDAGKDPRVPGAFPEWNWVQLKASELWVSFGELSALGDYMPNPEAIDGTPRDVMEKILQRMRQDVVASARSALSQVDKALYPPVPGDKVTKGPAYGEDDDLKFEGAAQTPAPFDQSMFPDSVKSVKALDEASASLGENRQMGLMARNACHFAPESWERWSLYHNEARDHAKAYHEAVLRSGGSLKMREGASLGKPVDSDEKRQAYITNGYASHFLQDSFAAGHLINKTLVMQYFAEWFVATYAQNPVGLSSSAAQDMTVAEEPGIAGERIYKAPRLHTSASEDRASGRTTADPQTAMERTNKEGRLAGTGVLGGQVGADKAFKEFGEFLNDTNLQLAANATHDRLNDIGLVVKNGMGQDCFKVGGDTTEFFVSDPQGIEAVFQADKLGEQAIEESLKQGQTSVRQEDIFKYFPNQIEWGSEGMVPLEHWNEVELKKYCFAYVFPHVLYDKRYWETFAATLFGPHMRDGGVIAAEPAKGGHGFPGE
jgi:hypothetical protein